MLKLPWRHLYFSGCGGVGMAGLAQIVCDCGVRVSGSDAVDSEYLTLLRQRGCHIKVGQDGTLPDDIDLLIYSSAIPPNNPERLSADVRQIPSCPRGGISAWLAIFFTHGVQYAARWQRRRAAMLAHWRQCRIAPGLLVWRSSAKVEISGLHGRKLLITEQVRMIATGPGWWLMRPLAVDSEYRLKR